MLIQFTFSNYKSFKDSTKLSMVASNYDKVTNEDSSVVYIDRPNLRLLRSTVIYGANASGKSKFIEAITFFKNFLLTSSKDSQKGEAIDVTPFLLNTASSNMNSEFEAIFILSNGIYRYGFEVNRNEIVAEWLYHKPNSREIELFYRSYQDIEIHDRLKARGSTLVKEGLIRNNSLMLSVLAQFNDSTAISILAYFDAMNCISSLNEGSYRNNTLTKVKNNNYHKSNVLELLRKADLGIQDIFSEDIISAASKGNRIVLEESSLIKTTHTLYNEEQKGVGSVEFLMSKDESHGTQKYFNLSGLILDALEFGSTLVIDELDSNLHPNLVAKIVTLFNAKNTNPKNAQLIFNTHDTNLLSSKIFRRDQIWFVDKNEQGESKLYSLADFKTTDVRKNESFEENYIRGKYGAIPYLGEFDDLIGGEISVKNGKDE